MKGKKIVKKAIKLANYHYIKSYRDIHKELARLRAYLHRLEDEIHEIRVNLNNKDKDFK